MDHLETSKNLTSRNILVLLTFFFSVKESNDQAGQDNCALGKKKSKPIFVIRSAKGLGQLVRYNEGSL